MTRQTITFIKNIPPKNNKFKIIYIDLVHGCNMECANCYLPNRDFPDVDTKSVLEFIDQFETRVQIRLIGGEPTLHTDIIKIIHHISNHPLRHRLTLVTNGLKLASKQFVKSLANAGLKTVYLSMNGFDDDVLYEKLDNMKCAKLKMKALSNSLDAGLKVAIGCIIVKNYNEHIIDKFKTYFSDRSSRVNFEFRNIGDIGRSMLDSGQENYTFDELHDLILRKFNLLDRPIIENDGYSILYHSDRSEVRVTNWEALPIGFGNTTNEIRGRMTQDFKLSPFLDNLKENEGQY